VLGKKRGRSSGMWGSALASAFGEKRLIAVGRKGSKEKNCVSSVKEGRGYLLSENRLTQSYRKGGS